MGAFKLLTLATDELVAETLAARWLDLLEKWPREKSFCIAISGGRMAQPFFYAVRKQGGLPDLDVHFFWADERCVPPTDPESNFRVAQEDLFLPLQIPAERIHRIRSEMPVEYAVAQAQAEICRIASLTPQGQPVLNLVILGMGEDGHVASLFPGEPQTAMNSGQVYRAVSGQKPPFHRITIGYPAIASAEKVWVAVSGPDKEVPLAEALSGHGSNPLSRVIRSRGVTEILTRECSAN